MKNIYKNNFAPMVFVVLTVVFIGLEPIAFAEKKPVTTKPGKIVKPGPRGPIGPDAPPSKAEKKLFANRIVVKGLTNEGVQLACDQASKADKKSPPPVVFLPAGKYEFNKTVNIPAGITIIGSGSKTICVNRQPKGAAFKITTPDVRITRLRIEGPSTSRKSRGRNSGVSVSSKSAQKVRIDHCEILTCCFGVAFGSQCGGQVDHCHIHHCIVDGLGYGVIPSSGAHVLMCDNDFGPCRHCIASNGALDWSSPKRLGKYVHKKGYRKGHWELVHNRFYGDNKTDYHRHWAIDTHPGMNGTFVVENNIIENIRMGLGIRDGAGIIKGNVFRNITRTAIIIHWGKHNGIVVEGTMPRDIDISKNRFEKVKKKYDIGKSENISIDGEILPKTKTERKGPKTKILRIKPTSDIGAAIGTIAVPDDCVQPLGFKVVGYPTLKELIEQFKWYHEENEKIRNADGSWGAGYGKAVKPPINHPLVRDTARRVLGYIDAHRATDEAIYKQRAKEGLEYLLKVQRPDGQFIWWYGDPKKGRIGGGASLYVTGIPAVAFMEGYKLFKDAKYLSAANNACDYLCGVGNSGNANYNLFATWALASNYEITKKKAYLGRATKFAMHALKGQLPSGGWSDRHNQMAWYHGIILRGLATLLPVMDERDPNRPKIQKGAYLALNHLIGRQQPDGSTRTRITGSETTWNSLPSHGIAVVAVRMNWPVVDSVRLAAKGVPPRRKKRLSTQGMGGSTMTIGSLMRAYKQIQKTK